MAIPKTTPARIQIQEVSPQVDCGRYPIKRTVGDPVEVTARIFRDGHETLGAAVLHRAPGSSAWEETPMEPDANEPWEATNEPPSDDREPTGARAIFARSIASKEISDLPEI